MKNTIIKLPNLIIALCIVLAWGCTKNHTISSGTWRGEFDTVGVAFPFHFTLEKKNDSIEFNLINGGETIKAQYVIYKNDSLIIKFPIYESVIKAAIKGKNGDTLKGVWIKTVFDKIRTVPFKATFGNAPLFSNHSFPGENVQGKWVTIFADNSNAIGVFKQDSNKVTGTFLESTGDERYLTGIVSYDSLFLIGFDGTSADLFTARVHTNDDTINYMTGMAFYGNGDKVAFNATQDDSAKLNELDSKVADKKLDFKFPDTNNKMISLSDDRYKNKVVIIDIMGSWCHNCLDETNYYVDFYNRYSNKGVEIVGLSFERTHDRRKAISNIKGFINHFNVPYEIVLAGIAQRDSVKKALPQIDEVYGYPTTIILNKNGEIAKTETGFSGPATGVYYANFKRRFEATIDSLLNSK